MPLDALSKAVLWAAGAVWNPWHTPLGQIPGPLILLLMGVGLFLTLRLRFIQVTGFREAARTMFPRQPSTGRGVLTPFQTFTTALAATIGMGNIAGVATAVVSGGPGAVFWIWCYGFFAMATKFTEAVLGVRFRVMQGNRLWAGPPYYLRDGLKLPWLAWIFALIGGIAALTTTPFTQPNSIALVLNSQLAIPKWLSGVCVAVLTWLVIIGGITAIGRTMEKLAPLKVLLYVSGGLVVILWHAAQIPSVLALILREAFSLRAAGGASAGIGIMVAMRYGLARGVYANEAGYGTAAVVFGTARTNDPGRQGLNAVMEVFIVSFVISSISALTILTSGVWQSGQTSTAVVAEAFDTVIPGGGLVVALCAFLFGYTALIGWSYYGEQFLEYVFGTRITLPYRWIYCILILFGAVAQVDIVWTWGDLMNGLQVFPNVIGIVGLSGIAAAVAKGRRRRPGQKLQDQT